MNEEIRSQILVFLSDKIDRIENEKISEIEKGYKLLDYCYTMDCIEKIVIKPPVVKKCITDGGPLMGV